MHVVIAAFDTPDGASSMLTALDAAISVGLETIQDAAVLTRDGHGRLYIEEPGDRGGARGATVGGLVGATLGLLAGPVGWMAGLGAVIGGLAARLRDTGFSRRPPARARRVAGARDVDPCGGRHGALSADPGAAAHGGRFDHADRADRR
jgi:hypothetical protein